MTWTLELGIMSCPNFDKVAFSIQPSQRTLRLPLMICRVLTYSLYPWKL